MPHASIRRRLPVAILFFVLAAGCCIPDVGIGWMDAALWVVAGGTWYALASRRTRSSRRRSGRVRTGVVLQPLAMVALSIPGCVVLGERIAEAPQTPEILESILSWPAPVVAAIFGIALYGSVQRGLHRPTRIEGSGYFYRSSYGS